MGRQSPALSPTRPGTEDGTAQGRWRASHGLNSVLKELQLDMRQIMDSQEDTARQIKVLANAAINGGGVGGDDVSSFPNAPADCNVLMPPGTPSSMLRQNGMSPETPKSRRARIGSAELVEIDYDSPPANVESFTKQCWDPPPLPSLVAAAVQSGKYKVSPRQEDKPPPEEDEVEEKRFRQKEVFPSKKAMMDQVLTTLSKPKYTVTKYYHTTGYSQALARNGIFENFTLGVIAFNALWMTVDTDYNHSCTLTQAHPVFILAENFFCIYFLFEWAVRFGAFEYKRNCLLDMWMVFDSILAMTMVVDTWLMTAYTYYSRSCEGPDGDGNSNPATSVLRVVKMVRLFRTARMARLLRKMPELMIMVKGIVAAGRSVFFTLLLLLIIIYVFSLAFCQVTDGSDIKDVYFSTVSDGMVSLLLDGTLPDNAQMLRDLGDANALLGFLGFAFVLLSGLTVLNMLVGVLVEVVDVVAQVEKEEIASSFVADALRSAIVENGVHCGIEIEDPDAVTHVNKDQFETLMCNDSAVRTMNEVDVDVVALVDLSDYLFKDGDSMEFTNLLKLVMQLRGNNTATVKDIIDVRKFILQELMVLTGSIQELRSSVDRSSKTSMAGSSSPPSIAIAASLIRGSMKKPAW